MHIDFDAFLAALPNIGKGYLGIFIVTAIIVLVVYMFNTIPEKVYEHERKKDEAKKNKTSETKWETE
ncbi:MAG: hypothetical protein E7536_11035 [Ruminococcaceae bacterium]|nr:hypothetical protein [Oscillospiraceae bacterium]